MPLPVQPACTRELCSLCKTEVGNGESLTLRAGVWTNSFSWPSFVLSRTAIIAVVLFLIAPAAATFPGQNGRIAYPVHSNAGTSNPLASQVLFLSNVGQFTQFTSEPVGSFGSVYSADTSPAWSPDGNWLAFIRTLDDVSSIEVVAKDGTGLRQVLNVAAIPAALPNPPFPELPLFHISSLAWSPDGQRISFFVNHSPYIGTGIWTVNVDGSGLTETVIGIRADGATTLLSPLINSSGYGADIRLAWSLNNQLVFTCSFRSTSSTGQPALDLCLFDGNEGPQQLPLNFADETQGVLRNWPAVDWSPDGTKILFNAKIQATNFFSQLFTIQRDGTSLQQLTNTNAGSCPPTDYASAHYSPDGQSIVAFVSYYAPAGPLSCSRTVLNPQVVPFSAPNPNGALAVLSSQGGSASILTTNPLLGIGDDGFTDSSWQPIPQGLTVNFDDGNLDPATNILDPLKGMKVELLAIDGTVLDDKPINSAGGTYVFENGGSYIGDFLIRATLIDNAAPSGSQPAFDVRYATSASAPIWMEFKVTLNGEPSFHSFSFSTGDPSRSSDGPGLSSDAESELDSMAAIYFRLRQYLDWVREQVPISNIPTVSVYTFATTDPDGDANADPNIDGAYYHPDTATTTPKIVLSPAYSDYQDRDRVGNDDGPFVEWHEFTHHLYNQINNRSACKSPYTPHIGYNNPDTCDSLDEGFADFLPTYAARVLLGQTTATIGSLGKQYSSTSLFDSRWDLTWPVWSWTSFGTDAQGHNIGGEEYAFAEVLWDLTVNSGNTQTTGIIGANGAPHVVMLTNNAPFVAISQIWTQLASPLATGTIAEFRESFGTPSLTIDLDGDDVPDVTPIDIPFIMNGFYPIDDDQQLTASHAVNYYDVGYALRHGFSTRDGAVGMTSHLIYDPTNTTVIDRRLSRSDVPKVPNANVALTVLDEAGAPLSGATAILTISFPGGQTNMIRTLDSASPALVYLVLPPYFNYPLPDGAGLPACDPANDVHVTVSITVVAQGEPSTTSPSFDNCTYWHAIAAATGPAALSFTVTVPVIGESGGDATPPTTTLALSPQPNGAGWNNSNVTATLTATDNAGGSGVKQITYGTSGAQVTPSTVVPGATGTLIISSAGVTTLNFSATDNAGNSEASNQATFSIDLTPPAINCGTPDGQWHSSDVIIPCSASDALSGLATAPGFTLSTSVPQGTETANASTGSQSVCDVAGNCTNAGPIGGNRIDKKAPAITLTAPAYGATYSGNQAVNAAYTCSDSGSGVASCSGTVANGSQIDTQPNGISTPKSFTVTSADNAGNTVSALSSYIISCHYVAVGISPSTVTRGGLITVSAHVMSCTGSSQTISVEFDLAGPGNSGLCSNTRTVMFTTPPFSIRKGTSKAVSFPFKIPKAMCTGTYSVTSITLIGKAAVDTTTATLTVN